MSGKSRFNTPRQRTAKRRKALTRAALLAAIERMDGRATLVYKPGLLGVPREAIHFKTKDRDREEFSRILTEELEKRGLVLPAPQSDPLAVVPGVTDVP